jgi:hypothetical protein
LFWPRLRKLYRLIRHPSMQRWWLVLRRHLPLVPAQPPV